MARAVVIAKYVGDGETPSAENFRVDTVPEPDAASLADGDILVRVLVVSPDPYMRGSFAKPKEGAPSEGLTVPIPLGKPVSGFVAGKIEASKAADLPVGSFVSYMGPYVSRQIVTAAARKASMLFIPLSGVVDESTVSRAIGVFGMPGLTAWSGVHRNLKPKAGEVLYVNGAGGVVGGLVAQIAVACGAKVVASAGTEEKLRWLRDVVKVHAAISYKGRSVEQIQDDVVRAVLGPKADAAAVKDAKAAGVVDCYFENVGGDQFTALVPILKRQGRVAICGAISGYNSAGGLGLSLSFPVGVTIYKGLVFRGHIVGEYAGDAKEFLADMVKNVKSGKVDVQETVLRGLDKFGEAYHGLMTGRNIGKMVVMAD